MASGENYFYDQPDDARKVDTVNAGYDQQSDPPAYTPPQYGNLQRGPYPMGPIGPDGDYPSQSIVMSQPVMTTVTVNPKPNDYMGWSVFTFLCCCLPLGLAALIYSSNARTASDNSNFVLAREESRTARNLNIAGLFCGIVIIAVMISLYETGVFSVKRSITYHTYGK